jgi:hypothetical protein
MKLRDRSGIYHWPPPWIASGSREQFPSVTTVLDETSGSDIAFAYLAFAEQAKRDLIELHRNGKRGFRWVEIEDESHEEGSYWQREEADPLDILAEDGYLRRAALQKMRSAADRGLTAEDLFSAFLLEGGFPSSSIPERVEIAIGGNRRCCAVEEVLPYAKAVWMWLDQMRPKVIDLQATVFNRTFGYAGRRDAKLKWDGYTWIVDLKTRSRNRVDRRDGKQLGAYWGAEFEGQSEGATWREIACGKRCRIGLLIATPERCGFRPYEEPKQKFRQFLHHLALWHSSRDKALLPLRTPRAKAISVPRPAAEAAAAPA